MTLKRESLSCIAFDCDSTLSTLEGIDELAARAGCEADIAPLTAAAMDGRLAIEEVYAKRLEILKPGRADLAWLGQRYIETIVDGAPQAIARLQAAGRVVCIVSGGLKAPVLMLAARLGVAPQYVRAVDVTIGADGSYAGFDAASPLTRSDGKAEIVRQLAASFGPVALIGDGVTDVAARQGGAVVIGFGGVARRAAVVAGADYFIDGPALTDVADYLLN
ncbi:MAG: HAD-IB family phosphatase [Hyphomicrobium sp.]